MPVYNEEQTIGETVTACIEKIGIRFRGFEIVVADDASMDGTSDALSDLRNEHGELRVLRNDRNIAHGPTLQRALDAAGGDLAFVIDSDYQHEPQEFWRL